MSSSLNRILVLFFCLLNRCVLLQSQVGTYVFSCYVESCLWFVCPSELCRLDACMLWHFLSTEFYVLLFAMRCCLCCPNVSHLCLKSLLGFVDFVSIGLWACSGVACLVLVVHRCVFEAKCCLLYGDIWCLFDATLCICRVCLLRSDVV